MQPDIHLLESSVRNPEDIHGYVIAVSYGDFAGLFILERIWVLSIRCSWFRPNDSIG